MDRTTEIKLLKHKIDPAIKTSLRYLPVVAFTLLYRWSGGDPTKRVGLKSKSCIRGSEGTDVKPKNPGIQVSATSLLNLF